MKRRSSAGQSMAEYLLVLVLVVIVLINGDPSPIEQVFDAFKSAYQRFTHAISMP